MLRSDHRELRNSKVKLGWVGGGWWVVVVVVVGVQGKDQYCSCSDAKIEIEIELRAEQSLSILSTFIKRIENSILKSCLVFYLMNFQNFRDSFLVNYS